MNIIDTLVDMPSNGMKLGMHEGYGSLYKAVSINEKNKPRPVGFLSCIEYTHIVWSSLYPFQPDGTAIQTLKMKA